MGDLPNEALLCFGLQFKKYHYFHLRRNKVQNKKLKVNSLKLFVTCLNHLPIFAILFFAIFCYVLLFCFAFFAILFFQYYFCNIFVYFVTCHLSIDTCLFLQYISLIYYINEMYCKNRQVDQLDISVTHKSRLWKIGVAVIVITTYKYHGLN